MTASIERNVYVLRRELPNPIHYVRGTNAISLIFHFRDIEIPSGVTAQVYVRKPSGKEVYNTAVISESDVTVDVTTQMFIEAGKNILQVQINQGEENLVTFEQPVIVHENYTEGDAEQSENESTLLQQYVDEVAKAAEDAKNEVQNEVANGKNDLDDYVEALKETIPADYTELSESVEQLERNKAPAIIEEASGAEITLDDSGPAPVKDLQLYGYSRQVTTTGAQLIPITEENVKGTSGLTAVLNPDGSIKITGTPTARYATALITSLSLSPGTYYVSGGSKDAGDVVALVHIIGTTGEFWRENTSFEVRDGDTVSISITYNNATLQAVDIPSFKPMLNSGTSALPWEPYSGGVASPSPDWAQPIHSVGDGGSVTVASAGANLFRTDNIPTTSAHGATVRNNNDGSLTISGTGELTNAFNQMKPMSHEETVRTFKAGKYVLSGAKTGAPYLVCKIQGANTYEANTINTSQRTVTFPQWIFDDESYAAQTGLYGSNGAEIFEQTVYPMFNRGSSPPALAALRRSVIRPHHSDGLPAWHPGGQRWQLHGRIGPAVDRGLHLSPSDGREVDGVEERKKRRITF